MAYLPQSQMEKDKEKELDQGSSTSEKVLSGGEGAIAGSSGSGATGGGAKASSFVNINDYLTANEGDNATKIGQAAAGTVTGAVDQAKSKASTTTQGFTGQAQAATVQDDADLRGGLTAGKMASTLGDKTKADTIKSKAAATYTGPSTQQFNDTFNADVGSAVTKAHSYGDMARDPGSTKDLLQATFKQEAPRYSGRLDHAILRGSTAGKAALEKVKTADSTLDKDVGDLRTSGESAITNAINTTGQTAKSFQDAIGGATGMAKGWLSEADLAASRDNASLANTEKITVGALNDPKQRLGALISMIRAASPNTSAEAAAAQANYMLQGNFDPSKFATATGQRYTAGDKLSGTQQADYSALRSFLGDDKLANFAPAAMGGKSASAITRNDAAINQAANSAQEGIWAKELQDWDAGRVYDYNTLAPIAGVGSFVAPSQDAYNAAFDTLKRYGVSDADMEFLKANHNIYKYVKQGQTATVDDMRAGRKLGPGMLVDNAKIATDANAWRQTQAAEAARQAQVTAAAEEANRIANAGLSAPAVSAANAAPAVTNPTRQAPNNPDPYAGTGLEGLFRYWS